MKLFTKITMLLLILLSGITCTTSEKKTVIIIVGNVHQAVPNYNADTLYNILDKVKPDIILHELDSSFFDSDFKFIEKRTSNEYLASIKYVEKNPTVKLRPYDFEGRNQYRLEIGARPTDVLSIQLIDSLYTEKLLTNSHMKIYKNFRILSDSIISIALKTSKHFNNSKTDRIINKRQYYQYKMLPRILNEREEFSNHFHIKPNGKKINYRNGFQMASNFWDLRNQTMAKNILKVSEQNKGKKIVVLCGFMHRYYILCELKKGKNTVVKEYYDK